LASLIIFPDAYINQRRVVYRYLPEEPLVEAGVSIPDPDDADGMVWLTVKAESPEKALPALLSAVREWEEKRAAVAP
jgi:hypothetical protein